jgi:hypothetical protein
VNTNGHPTHILLPPCQEGEKPFLPAESLQCPLLTKLNEGYKGEIFEGPSPGLQSSLRKDGFVTEKQEK